MGSEPNLPSSGAFPARLPERKPADRPLSHAMERLYDYWNPREDRANEFYSNFRYSALTGIGETKGVSRRDPTGVVKVGRTYFVWYTRRETAAEPVGPERATDEVPAYDWDHAEVWYATSPDGFTWQEQGVAVERAPAGEYGDRAAATPGILVADGGYYLYFQSFTGPFSAERGDYANVSVARADDPRGPWSRIDEPVIDFGGAGEWDSHAIHDPFPIAYRGKYWLYYKGASVDGTGRRGPRGQGVAIAERPEGPFVKSALNPVLNSGHETCVWPHREGVAAIVNLNGREKNTIQYAPDGLNFQIKSIIQMSPVAGGPFCPDAFSSSGDGRGIAWGLSHITNRVTGPNCSSFLVRFDCDLHRDIRRPHFKVNNVRFDEHTYFQPEARLSDELRRRIQSEAESLDREVINRSITS